MEPSAQTVADSFQRRLRPASGLLRLSCCKQFLILVFAAHLLFFPHALHAQHSHSHSNLSADQISHHADQIVSLAELLSWIG